MLSKAKPSGPEQRQDEQTYAMRGVTWRDGAM